MLPEEVTKFIGQSSGAYVFKVEKEAIRRYAEAIDDRNPLYWDEEYANKSRYGSIIAPPGFVNIPWYSHMSYQWPKKDAATFNARTELRDALAKAGFARGLNAGIEFEFFRTVRVGDTLAASVSIKDVVEREGKTGKMAFMITETTYINQNGDVVAKERWTQMMR